MPNPGSASTLGGTDPISTYRATFTNAVYYRFDNLSPAKRYLIDLTMYDGPTSTRRQTVTIDTASVAGCTNLLVNTVQRVQCGADSTSYAADGSIVVGVQCLSCSSPRVNEIALKEDARDIVGPISTPTATPTQTNTPVPTPTSSVQTTISSFAAQWSGGVVTVTWSTSSEYRTNQFQLWRSPTINPATWTQVNTQASQSNCATSTTPHSHGFTDNAVIGGQTYYYMLTWSGTGCGGMNGNYSTYAVANAPTPTVTQTHTPTSTPTPSAMLVGHVT